MNLFFEIKKRIAMDDPNIIASGGLKKMKNSFLIDCSFTAAKQINHAKDLKYN